MKSRFFDSLLNFVWLIVFACPSKLFWVAHTFLSLNLLDFVAKNVLKVGYKQSGCYCAESVASYILFTASAVDISHNAGKYDKDEEADDEIQG